jgi:hypothetical protein
MKLYCKKEGVVNSNYSNIIIFGYKPPMRYEVKGERSEEIRYKVQGKSHERSTVKGC